MVKETNIYAPDTALSAGRTALNETDGVSALGLWQVREASENQNNGCSGSYGRSKEENPGAGYRDADSEGVSGVCFFFSLKIGKVLHVSGLFG